MLESLLHFSIKNRWLVVILTAVVAAVGFFQLKKLPIDAVPDITNNQVQINAVAASLSPFEVEKQVTFPMENALAGIPGLQYTRSLSRNGFSQVTAVFDDGVTSTSRASRWRAAARRAGSAAAGRRDDHGPDRHGLGEVYMYTVEYEHPHGKGATIDDGKVGWQSDGSYLSPEGRRLTTDLELASYLREVQDWIIRPQLKGVKDVAGVDAIGGYVKQYHVQPDPMKLVSYGLTFHNVIEAMEKNNVSTGAGYVEHKGESYLVRATGRIQTIEEIESIVVGTRNGVPMYVRDVVRSGGVGWARTPHRLGQRERRGRGRRHGHHAHRGQQPDRRGGVDAKMAEIQRSLPEGHQGQDGPQPHQARGRDHRDGAEEPAEGAILVIVVLLLMLGNWRAAIICALAIPLSMLMTATGMVQTQGERQPDVAGRDRLRPDRGRRGHHRGELPAAAGGGAAPQGRLLTLQERLHEVVFDASKEVRKPPVFGEAIIITVYFPILALSGVEGKMFHPMAMTVIFALIAAFILSLTFIPAMVALCITRQGHEKDMFLVRWAKAGLRAGGPLGGEAPLRGGRGCGGAFVGSLASSRGWGRSSSPRSTRRTSRCTRCASLDRHHAVAGDAVRRGEDRLAFPEVAFVYSKTGTAELATDPMPPNVSDTFIIFKPKSQWRSEAELDKLIAEKTEEMEKMGSHGPRRGRPRCWREGGEGCARPRCRPKGHKGKLHQAARTDAPDRPRQQLRVHAAHPDALQRAHLGRARRCGRQGLRRRLRVDAEDRRSVLAVLQSIPGAPMPRSSRPRAARHDRGARPRGPRPLRPQRLDVQEVVAVAMGGREAGLVFEGDRRFDLVVRLPDDLRGKIDMLDRLPIPLPRGEGEPKQAGATGQHRRRHRSAARAGGDGLRPAGQRSPRSRSPRASTRSAARTASGASSCSATCAGETWARSSTRPRKDGAGQLPAGQWLVWGGQYENLVAAKERLTIVVPICFLLILLLLFATFKSVKYSLLVFSGGAAGPHRRRHRAVGPRHAVLDLGGGGLHRALGRRRPERPGHDHLHQPAAREGREARRRDHPRLDHALRPVLMTALVASLGFVPMALARGTGSEVQRPLATVVIGGLISSTLLTLVVLPALYRIFTGKSKDGLPGPRPEVWEKDEPTPALASIGVADSIHAASGTSPHASPRRHPRHPPRPSPSPAPTARPRPPSADPSPIPRRDRRSRGRVARAGRSVESCSVSQIGAFR
jgi:cobalt-zinc-cadmium resistance protein CzcA